MQTNIKTELVHVSHGQVFTDSLVIAENCELEHKNVIAIIRKYKCDFEEFSPLAFQTRKGIKLSTGGFAKSTEYAELTEDQATYLMTLFRNTEGGREADDPPAELRSLRSSRREGKSNQH